MELTLGFSPCPNDTFIFDALVNGAVDTEGLQFRVVLEDVQTLNNWAREGRLDVTKLSFPALFEAAEDYAILDAGAALGNGVGPLLIAKTVVQVPDMEHCSIAIPGENTTAAFLLSFAFPNARNTKPVLFSSIEDTVLNGETDLGVIIHENRFTYKEKGLVQVLDLGTYWEQKTGGPIPLGCIAVKRALPAEVQTTVEHVIRRSLQHAREHYPHISPYVTAHAQAMDEGVMRQHIELYVNDYTGSLGLEGKNAVARLHEAYLQGTGRKAVLSTNDLFVAR